MNKVLTYKQLCQNLAITESALRTNRTGRSFSTHGRSAELQMMKEFYPEQFKTYESSLLERLSKPYDVNSVLASIPKVTA